MKKIFIITLSIISFVFGTLISPSDGDELNYIHILFEWEQQPDAVEYNIQASNSPSFDNLFFDINNLSTVYIEKDAFIWDSNIYWRVKPIYIDGSTGDWIGTSMFSIGQSTPPYIDEGVEIESSTDIYQDDLLEDGYVAIGAFSPGPHSFIIDKYGNEIWNSGILLENEGWFSDGFILNHINEYGNISGYSGLNYPYNTGMKVNTDMDVVWSTMDPEPVDMHEFKQIPNGNYMGFQKEYTVGPIPSNNDMTENFQAIGYQADGVTPEFPWFGQKIVEWNSDHEVVWSWNPFDHFTMDDFDNYGGTWNHAYLKGEYDWVHTNAFHFDEEEGVIYTSNRHLSRITKIAYPSGDVIWNMGLPAEYNTGDNNICTDLRFSFQHNIQLVDDGDLLFFDNGNLSEMLLGDSNPTTRIRRIRVIDNSYCETIWEYELPPNLYGSAAGSVQLLDNGNYSIYTIGTGSVIEVTPEQEIIWKHTGNINSAWGWYYRAYKIPSIHPDAFSVIADNYTVDENNNNIIQIAGNSLDFTIINKSGYSLPYRYMFSDLMDGGDQLFIYDEGSVDIEPYGSAELSFTVNSDAEITSTQIMLAVWPDYHEYALKELMFSVLNNQTVTSVNYLENWNLVSLPMAVTDATYSSIYPDAIPGTLYGFFGTYVSETVLENGEGYWLFFDAEGSTDVSGNPIDQVTISLTGGWNLMGSLSSAFESSSIDDPEEIIISGSIYGFGGSYQPTSTLQPGKGYWINASTDGEVTLNSGGAARIKPFVDRTKDANVIRFNGMPLYFGVTMPENELQSYELPPKPPAGASDVRFKGGWRLVNDYGEVEVMNTSETLTISCDIQMEPGEHFYWALTSETGDEMVLDGIGEIVVPSAERFILERKAVVPLVFTLHQNFPNPFNPTTTLKYDLPEENHVTLTVYNMLGREVTQLINTTQESGFRSVQWNATDMHGKAVSAGVYLYQIRAGEFVQTKKMVLLK